MISDYKYLFTVYNSGSIASSYWARIDTDLIAFAGQVPVAIDDKFTNYGNTFQIKSIEYRLDETVCTCCPNPLSLLTAY